MIADKSDVLTILNGDYQKETRFLATFRFYAPTSSHGHRKIEDVLVTGRINCKNGVFDLRTFSQVKEDRLELTSCVSVNDVSVIDYRCERSWKWNWRLRFSLRLCFARK